jgi:hypothetical protein
MFEGLGKNKKIIVAAGVVAGLIIAGFVVYKLFIPDVDDIDTSSGATGLNRYKTEAKKLDKDVLETDKFQGLRSINSDIPELKEIQTGNKEPFGN